MKRALLSLCFVGICLAQSTAAPPEFEVASIKLALPGPQNGVWTNGSPDRIRMLNMSLHALITFAYNVRGYQVSGPNWMGSEKYDVIAKVSADEAKLPWEKKFALMRMMTRTLLADRFKLTLHSETMELPVYGLIVGKSGPKIQEVGPNPGDNVRVDWRSGHLSAKQMPMSQLVEILGGQVDRPVLDLTGVKGVFDVTLDWAPETAEPSPQETRPSLFQALQEQLGLKLDPRKSPIEVFVVDRAEKASEN